MSYRRGIGVRVKGVTGRDAIVHKMRRNSSQKGNAIVPTKSWLSSNSPCLSGFEAQLLRNSCAIVEHNLGERQSIAQTGVRAIDARNSWLEMAQMLPKTSVRAPGLSTDEREHPFV